MKIFLFIIFPSILYATNYKCCENDLNNMVNETYFCNRPYGKIDSDEATTFNNSNENNVNNILKNKVLNDDQKKILDELYANSYCFDKYNVKLKKPWFVIKTQDQNIYLPDGSLDLKTYSSFIQDDGFLVQKGRKAIERNMLSHYFQEYSVKTDTCLGSQSSPLPQQLIWIKSRSCIINKQRKQEFDLVHENKTLHDKRDDYCQKFVMPELVHRTFAWTPMGNCHEGSEVGYCLSHMAGFKNIMQCRTNNDHVFTIYYDDIKNKICALDRWDNGYGNRFCGVSILNGQLMMKDGTPIKTNNGRDNWYQKLECQDKFSKLSDSMKITTNVNPLLFVFYSGDNGVINKMIDEAEENNDSIGLKNVYDDFLRLALFFSNTTIVNRLLKSNKIDIGKWDISRLDMIGRSPLNIAAAFADKKVVLQLLKISEEQKINQPDNSGLTPLTTSILYGNNEITGLLLERTGININSPANLNGVMLSPLALAARNGNLNVVKALIAKHADLENIDLPSALALAAYNGYIEVVKELIAHSANVEHQINNGKTPLLFATDGGHLSVVKELIRNNVDVNKSDGNHNSALISAIQKGDISVVNELLAHGANVNQLGPNELSPLSFAILQRNPAMVDKLLARQAEVNKPDSAGNTPLIFATQNGRFDIVSALIAKHAEVNISNNVGDTPLSGAVMSGNLDVVKQLIANNAKVNYHNRDGATPLLLAARNGKWDIVKELLAHHALVNKSDNFGNTPLLFAIENGNINTVTTLLANQANVNTLNHDRDTPLLLAIKKGNWEITEKLLEKSPHVNTHDRDGNSPLLLAVNYGKLDVVKSLLARGVDVNKTNRDGHSPLLSAINNGSIDIVNELLAKNADVNKLVSNGNTALSLAASKGNLEIVRKLLAKEADINKADHFGNTPLFIATYRGNLNVVKNLIANHADVNKKNNDGLTPLYMAIISGNMDIINRLLQSPDIILDASYEQLAIQKERQDIANLVREKIAQKASR